MRYHASHLVKSVVLYATVVAASACADTSRPTAPSGADTHIGLAADPARAGAVSTTFVPIDVPGATGTVPMDINSHDEVVGRFTSGSLTHGFLRTARGALTTIDYPGALFTVASGINDEGDITGWYALAGVPGPLTERHGYLLRHGEFTAVDPAGSKFTNPLGINERGDIVGRFCTVLPCGRPGSGNYHGFLWHHGEATMFDVLGSRETNAWKINAEGLIVGAYRNTGEPNRLFTLRGRDFTMFDLPGVLPLTQDNGGINERGDIVGIYCDALPCETVNTGAHGYVLRHGELTTIDFPGAKATGVFGINARGNIAGYYFDGSGNSHGFLLSR